MTYAPFDSRYRMIWMFPRNIRIIYPWKLAQIIALLRNEVDAQTWAGNQNIQNSFCKALEAAGLKRPGEQYDSHSGGPRTYIAQLKSLGLIFGRNNDQLFYTQAGEDLYEGKPPLPILQKLLLRYQYPSPYGLSSNVKINPAIKIKPFLFVLKMMCHADIGGLSVEEMMIPVAFGHNSGCFDACVEKVLKFRETGDIMSVFPDCQQNLYTPRTQGKSISSRLEDVHNIANTMKNWMVAACFLDNEQVNDVLRFSVSPAVVPLIEEALKTEDDFLSTESEESFQRRFGCIRSEKDIRSLDGTPQKKSNVQETIVLSKYYALIGNQILDSYPDGFVEQMQADFGIPRDFTKEVIAPHLKHSLSFFESTYLELSSGGTAKATEFEKATEKIFSSKLGFKTRHTGQLKRGGKGGYADVFVIEKDGKCCGILDTKASSCYQLSSDDYFKMSGNYIPNYRELTEGKTLELEFCAYIAGGFKNITPNLSRLTAETKIGASALPASELLRIAQCETIVDQQTKVRNALKQNRILSFGDFNLNNEKKEMNPMPTIEHTFAELFCGPGGIGLGGALSEIRENGNIHKLRSVWANDIDERACQTYTYNHHRRNPQAVVCAPIEDVNMADIPPFEGLTFGFPCNDFSIVGEQKGINGRYGGLYAYGAELIELRNPLWFIAENVGGLRNANDGETFKRILEDLSNCGEYGYNVTANYYKFEEYGVPQTRHRIIMVGIRNDLGLKFKVPAPTTPTAPVSVREALEVPPIPVNAHNRETTQQSAKVVERLRFTPEGKNAWFIDEMLQMNDADLLSWLSRLPNLSDKERKKFNDPVLFRKHLSEIRLNVKSARMSQIYRRLAANQPSYTMTGSGGGGTHGYHWIEPRALTNRERARIQTFTDDYRFLGSKENVRKQIGMAVPPKGIKIIFEALLKTLNHIPYDSVDAKI